MNADHTHEELLVLMRHTWEDIDLFVVIGLGIFSFAVIFGW